MNAGRTVFSQLIEFLPHQEFQKCVARYAGNRYLKNLSCWDQYLAMAFAQLTYRESLRDIEACLRSVSGKLYHMGFRGKVARSTLADANESRDWRIYADFAQILIAIARPLYAEDPIGIDLDQSLYALDSTTIDLCLSLFPWARFRKHKAAVKVRSVSESPSLARSMRKIRSVSIWTRACMHWTPRPSTCACPCFRGRDSASTRPQSRCVLSANRHRSPALCGRSDRYRSGPELVCIGLHDHRLVPVLVSVGEIPQAQGRSQGAFCQRIAIARPLYAEDPIGIDLDQSLYAL